MKFGYVFAKSFGVIDRNDSKIRLKEFSIIGIFVNWKKSGKIHMYSDKLTNECWLKKSYVNSFFVEQIFFNNLFITFWNY